MDATMSSFHGQDEEDWQIFKDALAPTTTSRGHKAWERAPVAAHAPRLGNRKIWKRAGLRSQNTDENDKENLEAQAELEKEGAGARKKARVLGAKENLQLPRWREKAMAAAPAADGRDTLGAGAAALFDSNGSPVKGSGSGEDVVNALVVPRKRTNANHLITPKRRNGSKRRALEERVGSPLKVKQAGLAAGGPRLSPVKVLADGLENTEADSEVSEKPRRRKSLRKSIRLSALGLEEASDAAVVEPTEARVFTFGGDIDAPTTGTTDNLGAVGTVASEESPSPSKATENVQIEDSTTYVELRNTKTVENEQSGSCDSVQVGKVAESTLVDTDVSFLSSVDQNTSKQSDSEIDTEAGVQDQAAQSPACSLQDTIASKMVNSPKAPNSFTFLPAEPISPTKLSPRKTPSTPRRLQSALSQLNSIRRSARANRVTFVDEIPPVENSPQPTPEVIETAENTIEEVETSDLKATETDNSVELTQALEDFFAPGEDSILPEQESSDEESEENTIVDQSLIAEDQSLLSVASPNEDLNTEGNSEISLQSEDAHDETQDEFGPSFQLLNEAENTEQIEGQDPSASAQEGEVAQANCSILTSDSISIENTTSPSKEEADNQDLCLAIPFNFEGVAALPKKSLENADNEDVSDEENDETSEAGSGDEDLEDFGPISLETDNTLEVTIDITTDLGDLTGTTTPNPSTNALVEAISENATATTQSEDDTNLLRNFLTRVKANKEAKANASNNKRKRSFPPHSPLKLPLGTAEPTFSPSPPRTKDNLHHTEPIASPTKRRKRGEAVTQEEDVAEPEPQSIRRSGRTRLPVKASSNIPVPNFIPLRRFGQEGDNTLTLRRSEEKELAALTKLNTRKNKGTAVSAAELLARQAQDKEDPASRHQALKQKFDEKANAKSKSKKRKSVVWAEELARYQTAEGEKVVVAVELKKDANPEKPILPATVEKKSALPVPKAGVAVEEKKSANVRVGMRSSRIAMGMTGTGTPAPKRKRAAKVRA